MRLVIALSLLVASSFAQDEPDIFHANKAITTKRLSPRYAHGSAAYNGLVCVFGGFSDTNGMKHTSSLPPQPPFPLACNVILYIYHFICVGIEETSRIVAQINNIIIYFFSNTFFHSYRCAQ